MSEIGAINLEALHWSELVSLSQNGIYEPATIQNFQKMKFKHLFREADFHSHSQCVERSAVKLTSAAFHVVYGFEAKHRHILAKTLRHQVRSSFLSKGSYTENVDDMIILIFTVN